MRSTRDRIRHTLLFEVFGLALVIPLGTALFGLHASDMGVIGVGSALIAMVWNYAYNLGFDRAMQRLAGHTRKSLALRVAHAVLFEAGLLMILLPPIAWYLGIGLVEAFFMDLAIAGFYVAYAFIFNLAYDRTFPIQSQGEVAAGPPLSRTRHPLLPGSDIAVMSDLVAPRSKRGRGWASPRGV